MSTTGARTYRPNAAALMPGSAVRGFVVAIVDLPVVFVVAAFLDEPLAGTGLDSMSTELYRAIGPGGVVGLALAVPVVASLLLALAGYSRRQYELGEDGITERRGLIFRTETFLSYDDLDEVIYTQGKIQSFYNTGTIRLSDLDEDGAVNRQMRLSYVGNPEAVYTNVFRNATDPTDHRTDDRERPDVGELPTDSEYVSRLSGDSLAAGTGFRHLMPSAILHPNPGAAAWYGVLLSVAYSFVGFFVLYFAYPVLRWALYIPSDWHFLGYIAAGSVAFAAVLAGWSYWTYDRTQYELYDDHVRMIRGGERSTVALENVARLRRDDGRITSNDVGHVALIDDEGDQLLKFKFVADFDEVSESLEGWIGSTE